MATTNWPDVHEVGLEIISYGIDKFYDRAYDTFSRRSTTSLVRRNPSNARERPRSRSTRARAMARNEDRYYDTGYESEGGTSRRRSTAVNQDTYDPQQYGMRDFAARDGYQNDGGYAQAYADGRREQPQQYLDYPAQQSYTGVFDDPRSRSHNDLRETALLRDKARDERSYDGERDDRRSRRGKEREGSRSRSRPGSRRGFLREEDENGNTELKKWGATIAGAVVGGLAGRTAKKDNWVPTAVGAVLGGFAAREAEKSIVKRRHQKHRRREEEYEN